MSNQSIESRRAFLKTTGLAVAAVPFLGVVVEQETFAEEEPELVGSCNSSCGVGCSNSCYGGCVVSCVYGCEAGCQDFCQEIF